MWIFDWELSMNVHPGLNSEDHSRYEGYVVANQWTVVDVHSQIMPNVVRV